MMKKNTKQSDKTDEVQKKHISRMKKISYDEHFTRATDSIDLAKSARFVDIGDGISKRKESEVDRYTR